MEFNRPPRIQKPIPLREVTIPAPNSIPSKPTINWLTVLLPMVVMVLIIIIMSSMSTSRSAITYAIYFAFMGGSILVSIISYFQQKNDYKKSLEVEKDNFDQILYEKRKQLAQYDEELKEILVFRDPTPETCVQWPANLNHRLGERRPNDWDFLSFRVGEGNLPSQVKVQLPEEKADSAQFHDRYMRAEAIRDEYAELQHAPVTISLREIGLLGIAGKSQSSLSLAKMAVLHLSLHHWPTEVGFIVITEKVNAVKWNWTKNIPHRTSLYKSPVVPLAGWGEADFEISNVLERELLARQEIASENEEKILELPAVIVIFDRVPDLYEHAAFSRLLKFGPALKIYGVFLSPSFTSLPAECRATLNWDSESNKLTYEETGETPITIKEISPDNLSDDTLQKCINALSQIEWLTPDRVTEPPSNNFGLLDLFSSDNLDEIPILDYWSGEGKGNFTYLKTPIGKLNPTTPLFLDLNDDDNAHGPHGIIGGMTGSGKSVLLKTILLSYAITHHPYDLNFALIDYKGGGDFLELLSLPHVVGFITDIEKHEDYAHRVIQALSGELKKREVIIQKAQKQFNLKRAHIDDYRQVVSAKKTMPRLVIIFDEFAEFKERHKEESKQLISIARRGRSLGVHLILCTQNPQAAVDDAVKQNARFSISLKVNSVGDSKSLLGISDAWNMPIGQAFLKVRAPQKFKVAYPKMPYLDGELDETQAVLKKIEAFSKSISLDQSPPPKVWPDPLPENLFLQDILTEKDRYLGVSGVLESGFPIGYVDNPYQQIQPIYRIGGQAQPQNLIVFGGPGSGKSTFLLTIIMSLAQLLSPEYFHAYGLDLGRQNILNTLVDLPHIAKHGGVISGDESEKINRFFSVIRTEITERKTQFTSYKEYVHLHQNDGHRYPLIYILVDGLTRTYLEENPSVEPQLLEIVRDGLQVGVRIIIATNTKSDVRKLENLINDYLILTPKDKRQITDVISYPIGHFGQMEVERLFPPGRGIFNEQPVLAFQAALPVKCDKGVTTGQQISIVVENIKRQYPVHGPSDVIELPTHLSYQDVESYALDDKPVKPLGVLQETYQPLDLSPRDFTGFWIASTFPELGKTNFLINTILSFAEAYDPEQLEFIFIDFHSRDMKGLKDIPHRKAYISKPGEMEEAIEILLAEINKRNDELFSEQSPQYDEGEEDRLKDFPNIIVVIDDLRLLINKDTNREFEKIIPLFFRSEDLKIKWIITSNVGELSTTDQIIKRVTQLGTGILLGGSEGLDRFGAAVPYGQRLKDLPPGRGYFVMRGIPQIFQAATYWHSDPKIDIKDRVESIRRKYPSKSVEVSEISVDISVAKPIDKEGEILVSEETLTTVEVTPQPITKIIWDANFSIPQLYQAYNINPGWDGKAWGETNIPHHDPVIGWVKTSLPALEQYESENPVRATGHTLITGISGSGKSLLLKTYALSLALLNSPDMAQIYFLDDGGWENFPPLDNLPHVSHQGIVSPSNEKQADLWFESLEKEQAKRLGFIRKSKASNFDQYQCLGKDPLSLIHVLIDNWERNNHNQERLQKLVEQGRTCGMRFIITALNPGHLALPIRENFYTRIILGTSEKVELLKSLETTEDVLEFHRPWRSFGPGEGFIHTWLILKFKAAFPSMAETLPETLANSKDQNQERVKFIMDENDQLVELVKTMNQVWKNDRKEG